MGAVFEWYQSNQSIAYPFVNRQTEGVHELFIDAALSYHTPDNPSSDNANWVQLSSYDLGTPLAPGLFRYAAEFMISVLGVGSYTLSFDMADPNTTFTASVFGSYTVYEWVKSTTIAGGFTKEDSTARLVVLTSKLADFPTSLTLADGQMVASLATPYPKTVRRLFVKRALSGDLDPVTHPKVVFEAGNNIQLSLNKATDPAAYGLTTTAEARAPNVITVDAEAGLGSGYDYRCSPSGAVKTINGVGADERGNFILAGKDCTWVERPMKNAAAPIHPYTDVTLVPDDARWPYTAPTQVGPGVILHQNCNACCACADYVAAYQAMYALWIRGQNAAVRVAAVQTLFNSTCQLVKDGDGKVPEGMTLRLTPMSRPDFSLALSGLMFNNSAAAIPMTQLDIVVDQPSTYVNYVTRSGYLDIGTNTNVQINPLITPVGDTTKYTIVLGSIEIGEFARFGFVLRFNANLAYRASAIITCTATAVWSGGTASDVQRTQLTPPLLKT